MLATQCIGPVSASHSKGAHKARLQVLQRLSADGNTALELQVSKAVEARRQLVQRCPLHVFKLRGVTFDGRQVSVR
jgi:hypothetical protein